MSYEFDGCLKKLNEHLADKAFITGFEPNKKDAATMMKIIMTEVPKDLVHVNRWLKQMSSYTMAEMKQFKGECCCCCKNTCAEEKKEEKKAEPEGFNLDSESSEEVMDEETKKKMEETRRKIAEAKAQGKKLKKVDRSMLIIHIKPWEDTANMQEVLDSLPQKVQMEGLTWGKGELQDGPYNIKYVAVACIIVDDLCSADELAEKIVEAYGDDLIQNADIVSFNKCE